LSKKEVTKMHDILTVAWKERKMLLRYRGGSMRYILTVLSPVLLAVYTAWGSGTDWVELPIPAFPAALVAVLAVIIIVPESFAGERERRTLETLLATRLSDSSIIYGKMLVAILSAMVLVAVILVLGLVTVNVSTAHQGFLMYTATNLVFCVFISLVFATMITAIGILISLKSETVQEATQTLAGAILVPPILIGMLGLAFRDQVVRYILTVEQPVSMASVVFALLVITGVLVLVARNTFRRSNLL
jgi:ABC-2 type transport system permease protein